MDKIHLYDKILSPMLTEKTTNLSEQNKIVFKVPSQANKTNLKKNIEKIFKVNVTKINIINKQNRKVVKRGKKVNVQGYKKAIITLKKGQSIDLTTGIYIMALKTFKPYTKSTRGTVLVDRTGLWKGKPFKMLVEPKNSMRGRNNNGHITSRNMSGGGHKKMYRLVDFYRKKFDVPGTVERIEYDPNRSCYIMLIKFEDGTHFYYLAPQKINVGDLVENGSAKEIKVGNCMPLRDIPVGVNVHNVELQPGGGGKIARSAGTSVTISGLDGNYSLVKMTSGEVRRIDSRCMATIGVLSNPDQKNIKIGKAGRSRWLGRRPHTRGVVMNPVDHPHGGGEGKSAGGRHPVSPTGQGAKGLKTRTNARTDKFIVKRRNKRKDTKK